MLRLAVCLMTTCVPLITAPAPNKRGAADLHPADARWFFGKLDQDSNGAVSPHEMWQYLSDLAEHDGQPGSSDHMTKLFESMDTTRDRSIEFEELLKFLQDRHIAEMKPQSRSSAAKEADPLAGVAPQIFAQLDKDGDGLLDVVEGSDYLAMFDDHSPIQFFKSIDKDHSGRLTLDEFATWIRSGGHQPGFRDLTAERVGQSAMGRAISREQGPAPHDEL